MERVQGAVVVRLWAAVSDRNWNGGRSDTAGCASGAGASGRVTSVGEVFCSGRMENLWRRRRSAERADWDRRDERRDVAGDGGQGAEQRCDVECIRRGNTGQ